jgi:hypothetical protein
MAIDWNKPLRLTKVDAKDEDVPVTVVRKDGVNAHVTWTNRFLERGDAFVTSTGALMATLHAGHGNYMAFVENIPEEPKEWVTMFNKDGKWQTVGCAVGGYEPTTKKEAEETAARTRHSGLPAKIVHIGGEG